MQTSLWTRSGRMSATAATRAARAGLERELASYNTRAEPNDLYAILDRYSDQETADIRRILAAQQASPRRPAPTDCGSRAAASRSGPAPSQHGRTVQRRAAPQAAVATVFRLSAILGWWSAVATNASGQAGALTCMSGRQAAPQPQPAAAIAA